MTVIRYSAGRLLGIAFFTGAMAAFWLWMLVDPDTFMEMRGRYAGLVRFLAENAWASGGLFMLFAGLTVVIVSMALGDRTALALSPNGVDVRTTFGRHRFGWDAIAMIRIEPASKLSGGGESLTVRARQDLGEKVVRLSTGLLEQSRWEINRQLEALGRPGVGSGLAAVAGAAAEDAPAVDYDAVIARHLAARDGVSMPSSPAPGFARPAGPAQPARGGFGRKGL